MSNKNLRRISVVVTAQTDYHLKELCAEAGWGEKDKGKVIDKLVRCNCASRAIERDLRKENERK